MDKEKITFGQLYSAVEKAKPAADEKTKSINWPDMTKRQARELFERSVDIYNKGTSKDLEAPSTIINNFRNEFPGII